VYAVAVLSVVVLARATASISLCQASFMGVSAYAFAWLFNDNGWPMWPALLVGALIAAPVGMTLAFPALRMRGLELSVLTLSVGLALTAIVFAPDAPLSISDTGASLEHAVSPFGLDLTSNQNMYWFQLGLAIVAYAAIAVLLASPVGATWKAMRSGNAVAAASGIRISRYQILGFGLSALLAGLAGVMLLMYQSVVTPDAFGPAQSIFFVVVAMVAGIDKLRAGVLAGLVFGAGQQVFTTFGLQNEILNLVFGFSVVIAIVAFGRRTRIFAT
jgi:branched-chain amino acid transport system permease protein